MIENLSIYSAIIFVFIFGILEFTLLMMGQKLRIQYLRARCRAVIT